MGVYSEILIKFPKEGKHITGRPLKGTVKYHLDKETTYRRINLALVGRGYCSWYETDLHGHSHRPHNHGNIGNRYKCEGQETIEVMKIDLLNKTADENVTLSAGAYEQSFEFILPENIPPTIKTNVGEIKYNLVLKFKKQSFFSKSKQFKTRIQIYPKVDSSIPDEPIVFGLDKTLTKIFSSKTHEINLIGELDKRYLTSSSPSKISFTVTNNSDVIVSVKTELVSKTKYRDEYGSKKTEEEVLDYCTVKTPSVPDNSVANMFNIIPMLPELHTVRHSKIITREYKLRVILNLPLPHLNESIEVPVFIGDRFNENNDETDLSVAIEELPSYWEVMAEDKSKD